MLSPQDAWRATLGQLQLRLSRAAFETWLKGAELVSYEDGEFVVKVRHAFAKDWLERRLQQEITDTLSRIFARSVRVSFIVRMPHRNTPTDLSNAGPLFAHLATARAEQSAQPAAQPLPLPNMAPLLPAEPSSDTATAPNAAAEPSSLPAPRFTAQDYIEWDPRFTDVRRSGESEKSPDTAPDESLPLIEGRSFATFVTGSNNAFAHAAAQAVAAQPGERYNPLVIYGGVGLGKTHLLQAIGHACQEQGLRVLYVTAEAFTNETVAAIRGRKTEALRQRYRHVDVLLVDDVEFMIGKKRTEEEFFHTFNTITGKGGQVVVTLSKHPRELSKLDERLRSRLEGGLVVDLQAPSQSTREDIVRAKARAQASSTLPDDVVRLLAEKVTGSIRELEGALTQVLARATLTKQPLTVEMAAQALGLQAQMRATRVASEPPTIKRVLEATATYYQLSLDDLLSKRRTQKIARARQIAMYLAREETQASLPQIGEALGGRNHSTILYGYKKIAQKLPGDAALQQDLAAIREQLTFVSGTPSLN